MTLLDNKALKVDGIANFSWSPVADLLAFWVPEKDPKPARVTVLSIPTKDEVAVKNLYNVVSVRRRPGPACLLTCCSAS